MTMAETPTTPTTPTEAPTRRSTSTDIALIAAFAALIAACTAIGGIPVGGAGVDITLQTFGICFGRTSVITSAPISASSMQANGPGPMPANSTMRVPFSGPVALVCGRDDAMVVSCTCVSHA